MPLPPFAEQQRIVAAIEEWLAQIDDGVAMLQHVQQRLKRYREAVLKAASEGTLVPQDPADEPASELLRRILDERRARWEAEQIAKMEAQGRMVLDDGWKEDYQEPAPPDTEGLPELSEGWVWTDVQNLGSIGEQVVLTGPFGADLGQKDFITSGVPVLTIGCLTEHGLDLSKASFVSDDKAAELVKYTVKSGDLLFSRMASVGRVGLVSKQYEDSIINYHLMRLRLAFSVILPEYFVPYVRGSSEVANYLKKVNHGATRNGINTNQLLALPIALPPFAEQQRIVAEVERRLSVIENIEATIEVNLKRADRLRQIVLEQAFAGKLVPQHSDDEPADVLLQRIAEERAKHEAELQAAREAAAKQPKARGTAVKTKKSEERRPLHDVLVEAGAQLTPGELFQRAEYHTATGLMAESVELFY